jgi:hypothetical protein
MGMNRVFLPQDALDRWSVEEKIQVEGDVLTINEEGRSYDLVPAVRFMSEVGGTGDPPGLVGKVKERPQLQEMAADYYPGSVILGDSAYEVVDGFVGYPRPVNPLEAPPARASAASIGAAVTRATGETATPDLSDEALLTKFLLDNLSG